MSPVEEYLRRLNATLRVRGRARRRVLAECRDHLVDASEAGTEDEAVRRFGPVADVARELEVEIAVRRARTATMLAAGGVLGIGGSTLAMVHAADPPGASGPLAWAIAFFAFAQTAAAAVILALLRAAAMRYEAGTPAEVLLLCRRNWVALGFAALTMLATGVAFTGHAAAWKILLGPAVGVLAGVALLRAGGRARRHVADRPRAVHSPLADVASIGSRSAAAGPRWIKRPSASLVPTLAVTMASAYWWNYFDHGTAGGSGIAAGIEAACVLAGFTLLGPALGIRGAPSRRRTKATA